MNLTKAQERRLKTLETHAKRIDQGEAKLRALRDRRAELIRAALDEGIPKTKVAEAVGVHRSRLYALLDEAGKEDGK